MDASLTQSTADAPAPGGLGAGSAEYCVKSKYFISKRKKETTAFSYTGGVPLFSYNYRNLTVTTWSNEQRLALKNAIAECAGPNGQNSIAWDRVAIRVGGDMTPMECLMQYRNVDHADIRDGPWTPAEIDALTTFVRDNGNNWAACAEVVGNGRTPFQCISYYQRCVNNTMVKRDEWTDREDAMLLRAIKIYNLDWANVSNCMEGRTPKQCLQRWDRFLQPAAVSATAAIKGPWKPDEERRLYLAAISCSAPTAKDSSEEKKKFNGWKKVAEFVPARGPMQCREKWTNVLDPYINRQDFTEEEDRLILSSYEELNTTTADAPDSIYWSKLAEKFNGRTDNQIYRRWKTLSDSTVAENYLERKRLQKRYLPAALGRTAKMRTDPESQLLGDANFPTLSSQSTSISTSEANFNDEEADIYHV